MTAKDPDGFSTLAIRAGQVRTPEGEHAEPIFTTSSFVFESAEQAAARFAETEPGNIYSRFTNPTVRCFEQRLAALEGGAACVATSSGMGAILATCMALVSSGDRIVCSDSVFGSTITLMNRYMRKFGVDTRYVSPHDTAAWAEAIDGRTRLVLLETPSNPLAAIADIAAIAEICRGRGALLAVDNCFCTPALQRPLSLGADLVIHSATKYLDGQGRCVGGAVVGSEDTVGKEVFAFIRAAGPSMSPFNAWVFLQGLETLQLRGGVRIHQSHATDVDHRESRRHEDDDHSPGHDDACAHRSDRAGEGGHHRRPGPDFGRSRGCRRSAGRSRTRARGRGGPQLTSAGLPCGTTLVPLDPLRAAHARRASGSLEHLRIPTTPEQSQVGNER